MISESFKFILHDTTYSATALLGPQSSLTVCLTEVPAFFTPFQEGQETNEYTLRQRRFSISYDRINQTLEFLFNSEDNHIGELNFIQNIKENLESTLGAIRLHELPVSSNLLKVVQDLSSQFNIRVVSLTHTSSEVVVMTPLSLTPITIKTEVSWKKESKVQFSLSMSSQPKLLGTALVEPFNIMRRPFVIKDVYSVRSR